MQKLFLIYKAQKGRCCRVQFLNTETGRYMGKISTGTKDLKEAERIALQWLRNGIPERGKVQSLEKIDYILTTIKDSELSMSDAQKILLLLQQKGFINKSVILKNHKTPLIDEYLLNFWDFEKSPYVKELLSTGKAIGKTYCKQRLLNVKKHILPFFGKITLSEISSELINDFLFECKDKSLSARYINLISVTLCVPLRFAYKKKVLERDPTIGVIRFSGKAKERGILTFKEVKELFAIKWDCQKSYVANYLASQTGLRLGEVLALRKKDIGLDRLFVANSWSREEHLKCTKTAKSRIVPLLPDTRQMLLELVNAEDNSGRDDDNPFVFYSALPILPETDEHIRKEFYKALAQIGIDAKERVERNIVFHSWRHYVSTFLANNSAKRTGMSITGHTTESVFDMYSDHEAEGDFEEKMKAIKKLSNAIDFEPEEKKTIDFANN